MWAESTIVCDVKSAVSKLKSHEHVEVTSGWGRFQCELEKYGPTTDVQLLKRVEVTRQGWEDYWQGNTPEQFMEHKWKNEALRIGRKHFRP